MAYHVGTLAKKGGEFAHTIQQDGQGFHIAECRFRSSADLICKALNQYIGGMPSPASAATKEKK